MKRLVVIIALLLSLGFCGSSAGEVVFSENWDSGVINTAVWTLRDSGDINIELREDLSNPGDYALALVGQYEGPVPQWGDEIYSKTSFNRGAYTSITFKTWQGSANVQYSCHGGFHNTTNSDVYNSMEAAIGYIWSDLRAAGGNDGNHGLTGTMSGFTDAIILTNSKSNALTVRITMGPVRGARWEWSDDDGLTWNVERDNIGDPTASDNLVNYIGFGPFSNQWGTAMIDDIVVERLPINLEETDGSTVVDEQGPTSDIYYVVFASAPSDDVSITITPDDQVEVNGAGQNNSIELTFTTTNWDTPQTVTVAAIDDELLEELHTATITHSFSSTDPDFNNLTIELQVTVNDNEVDSLPTDIRNLTNHFNESGGSLGYWTFGPANNIADISTSTHPGLATVQMDDQGQDVKGLLKNPIPIDEYPLPWEFQLGMSQNFNVAAGAYSVQANVASGLNIAVTFSDPATWPQDRTQLPPETYTFQLLTVHLGGIGTGLPQLLNNPNIYRTTAVDTSGEAYLVYGRGDLGSGYAYGHWEIPYMYVGDGSKYGGPASWDIFYRCVVRNSRYLSIGIKFKSSAGWHERLIDCAAYGPITGIWEIGPIFSGDNWIPDTLCPAMGIPDTPVSVDPPDPRFPYHVDYCFFHSSRPIPFEDYSDDFDVLGFVGKWVDQPQNVIMDTYSNPGYLTWTLLGPSLGTGIAPVGGDLFSLDLYPPPWEMEICFIPPEDTMPWNFYMNFAMQTNQDRGVSWYPSVTYDPALGIHKHMSQSFVQFDPPVPESILSHKPIYMIIQWIDRDNVRYGFKAEPNDSWYFSEVYDFTESLNPGEYISGNFRQADWSTVTGSWGGYYGIPKYTQFLIDYIHYRYGLTDRLDPEGSPNVSEEGPTSSTYTIECIGEPTADVVITIDPDDQLQVNGAGRGNPVQVTFTAAQGYTEKTITVTAIDDGSVEGNHAGIITHTSASLDSKFDDLVVEDMVVQISDNDHTCGEPGQVYGYFDVTGPNGVPDCYVDFYDFSNFVMGWLDCTNQADPDCL